MSDNSDVRIETIDKRVRVLFAGQMVADTRRPRLVWENPYYPAYYLPARDVRTACLTPSARSETSPTRGIANYFDVQVDERIAKAAAWRYADSPIAELRDLVRFEWAAMDAWFEEDDEVFGHPHDPYKRIDILQSSRHVRVSLRGELLAETQRPTLLLETGLPTRYYVRKTDVNMATLTPIAKRTCCAYKGYANYWVYKVGDAVIEQDVAWSYAFPLAECAKIAGLVGFYNETLDIEVDGGLLAKPVTEFSR